MNSNNMVFHPYLGEDPFFFVSYSHVDYLQIESILRMLHQLKLRIWFDEKGDGITAGENWKDFIDERLEKSKAFIAFLSSGFSERSEVLRELRYAIKRQKEDPDYVVIPILLQRISSNEFPTDIKEAFQAIQYIGLFNYQDYPEKFKQRFISLIQNPQMQKKLDLQLEQIDPNGFDSMDNWDLLASGTGYVYSDASPEERFEELDGTLHSFYALHVGETTPNTVNPLALDNTWCPEEFYEMLESDSHLRYRRKIQAWEVYRGLLHSPQVLINRAFLQNNDIFIDWYSNKNEDYDAFCKLLETGALTLYIFKEDSPWQEPTYSVPTWKNWMELCKDHKMYCLKLDWDSTANARKADRALSYAFHNFCLTAADDVYLMEDLKNTFQIQTDAFQDVWKRVQKQALSCKQNTGKNYTREQFYKDFVIKDNAEVKYSNIDLEKPFSKVLKRIIDLKYNLNLSQALGLKLLVPKDWPLDPSLLAENSCGSSLEKISADELAYAIGSFETDFLNTTVCTIHAPELALHDVCNFRELKSWHAYIRSIEAGKKRAKQWAVEYFDIFAVWNKYQIWVNEAAQTYSEAFTWKQQPATLSIRYRIGSYELVTVYDGSNHLVQKERLCHPIPEKTTITIDYFLGNLLEDHSNDCFFDEIRLFQGTTTCSGNQMIQTIKEKLRGIYGS